MTPSDASADDKAQRTTIRAGLGAARRRLIDSLSSQRASPEKPALPADRGAPRTAAPGGLSLLPYRSLLPDGPDRRIVVLARSGLGADLVGLVTEFKADDVYVLGPDAAKSDLQEGGTVITRSARSLDDLSRELKTLGPAHVIVDLLPAWFGDDRDVWQILFFHLVPGGVYVLANRGLKKFGQTTNGGERVQEILAGQRDGPDDPRRPAARELSASTARFTLDRSFLLVEKQQRHYVKLRDDEIAEMLPQRNGADQVTVLATLPGGELACRGEVISHEAAVPILNLPLVMAYPELRVHHYEGRFGMVSNSLLFADSTILPGSFRYPLTKILNNPRLDDVSPDFSRLPDELRPRKLLAGTFYHLDCWNTGHFGHLITEVVSRLWGWSKAKEQIPELKAIFRRRYPYEASPELELSLFARYGIERSDIVWTDEPVWLESVVTATSMWQNGPPYYVHPQIERTWERLRPSVSSLLADRPRRIFVSRHPTLKNRSCRNIDEVEDVFARHGFSIVFPEELSLADQATVFGGAEVVAGLAGSGLYNVLYSGHLSTFIVLSQEAYSARYEHLYTMVLGCTTHYFWSTPDIPHPPDGWTEEAYYSSWEFDFPRNGEALEDLLSGLAGRATAGGSQR